MKPIKRIRFTGFPDYHNPRNQPYYQFLADRYTLTECDTPDYIIDGGQSFEHIKYDASIKILISSENDIPDFNTYDYAVSSTVMDIGDRYLRVPWCAFSPDYCLLGRKQRQLPEKLLSRKFCSFVVSNAEFGDPLRMKFFTELSKYKKVDSGGRFLNNIGGAIKDKISFCSGYKFNIAFENSSSHGYVTEKIVDSYSANSIPIYYGDPVVENDFRRESMVYVKDESDIDRAIEEIIRLDSDDEAYLEKLNTPCLSEGRTAEDYNNNLKLFLSHIFDQPLSSAFRLCPYGHQAMMRRHLGYLHGLDYRISKSWVYHSVVSLCGKIRAMRLDTKR